MVGMEGGTDLIAVVKKPRMGQKEPPERLNIRGCPKWVKLVLMSDVG